MTVVELLSPVSAATVVNAFVIAGFWRGGQIEKATGRDPWWLWVGSVTYGCAALLFLYAQHGRPLAGWLGYFGAALVSEAAGVLLVFAILNALFFQRGQALKHRIGAAVGAFFMLALILAPAFV